MGGCTFLVVTGAGECMGYTWTRDEYWRNNLHYKLQPRASMNLHAISEKSPPRASIHVHANSEKSPPRASMNLHANSDKSPPQASVHVHANSDKSPPQASVHVAASTRNSPRASIVRLTINHNHGRPNAPSSGKPLPKQACERHGE